MRVQTRNCGTTGVMAERTVILLFRACSAPGFSRQLKTHSILTPRNTNSTCASIGSRFAQLCRALRLLITRPIGDTGVRKQERLDDLEIIKAINYIRQEVAKGNKPAGTLLAGARPWDEDKYLQPVLPDDGLLQYDFEDLAGPRCLCCCSHACHTPCSAPVDLYRASLNEDYIGSCVALILSGAWPPQQQHHRQCLCSASREDLEVHQLREENAVLKTMLLEQRFAPPSSKARTL